LWCLFFIYKIKQPNQINVVDNVSFTFNADSVSGLHFTYQLLKNLLIIKHHQLNVFFITEVSQPDIYNYFTMDRILGMTSVMC